MGMPELKVVQLEKTGNKIQQTILPRITLLAIETTKIDRVKFTLNLFRQQLQIL